MIKLFYNFCFPELKLDGRIRDLFLQNNFTEFSLFFDINFSVNMVRERVGRSSVSGYSEQSIGFHMAPTSESIVCEQLDRSDESGVAKDYSKSQNLVTGMWRNCIGCQVKILKVFN